MSPGFVKFTLKPQLRPGTLEKKWVQVGSHFCATFQAPSSRSPLKTGESHPLRLSVLLPIDSTPLPTNRETGGLPARNSEDANAILAPLPACSVVLGK